MGHSRRFIRHRRGHIRLTMRTSDPGRRGAQGLGRDNDMGRGGRRVIIGRGESIRPLLVLVIGRRRFVRVIRRGWIRRRRVGQGLLRIRIRHVEYDLQSNSGYQTLQN